MGYVKRSSSATRRHERDGSLALGTLADEGKETMSDAITLAIIDNGQIPLFFTQIVSGAIVLIAIWLNTRLFDRGCSIGWRRIM